MPISKSELSKQSLRTRKLAFGFAVGILLFCGLGALIARRWVDVFDYSADLDRLVAEAKERKLPFTAKDLDVVHADPSENSKTAVLNAMRAERLSSAGRLSLTEFKPSKGIGFPKDLDHLASVGLEISKYSYFDGEKDRDFGVYVRYPEYGLFKDVSKALSLRAQQYAIEGKIEEALADLAAIRNLGIQLKNEKQIIGGLVNLAINQIFIRGCLRSAQSLLGNPGGIKKIRDLVAADLPSSPFRDCFAGEFYNGITLARNYAELGGSRSAGEDGFRINPDRLIRDGLPKNIVHRGMLASYIRHSIFIVDTYDSEKNLYKASLKADRYIHDLPKTVSNALPTMMLPVFSQAGIAWERQGLTQKMATTWLDLLTRSKFPATIPPIEDTLGGGQIIYEATSDGFKIYSKGKNAKDDGGPRNKSDRKSSDDIGFEYPLAVLY